MDNRQNSEAESNQERDERVSGGLLADHDRLVSIIVPVYNASAFIAQTIRTVADQTYEDWELILIDDCSTDDSLAVIDRTLAALPEHVRGRIRISRNEKNMGASGTRNAGLSLARGRYISFLDADDLWDPHKLDLEMNYMKRNGAAFVFCSYKYGNSEGVPTGKVVRAPRTLTYEKALSRTVIFTSTVLIDTKYVSRELIRMPDMPSEDTATWWTILKSGVVAYGLDMPLVIYRRPDTSLSSNKLVSIRRIWNLFRKIANLSVPRAFLMLIAWAWRASVRRTVDDVVRNHFETLKQFTAVQLSLIGLIVQTVFYAFAWFRFYYPILHSVRISRTGINHGRGLVLYSRGHMLVICLYFLILVFFSSSNGSMKTGYSKPGHMFGGKVVSLLFTDIITYAQISIIWNWIADPRGMALLFLAQVLFSLGWTWFSDFVYRKVFHAKETLVIAGEGAEGSPKWAAAEMNGGMTEVAAGAAGDTEEAAGGAGGAACIGGAGASAAAPVSSEQYISQLLQTREDRFNIVKVVYDSEGVEKLKKECVRWYSCVVMCGVRREIQEELLLFCYQHRIRVYLVPDIHDLLMQGTEQMDLFDSAMLVLREYSISWGARAAKRFFDILLSGLAIIGSSPVMIYRAVQLKRAGKKVFRQEACAGRNGKVIQVTYFNDDGFGHTLPRMFNIFMGSMSLVGPQLLTTQRMEALAASDENYRLRARVKPGITGYSQIHGRIYSEDLQGNAEALKLDLYYLLHYSFMMDFRILISKHKA